MDTNSTFRSGYQGLNQQIKLSLTYNVANGQVWDKYILVFNKFRVKVKQDIA